VSDPRPWTYAALFGTLWGAVELTAGTVLKMSRLPLAGTLLAVVGLVCMVTLRRLQPRRGVCLLAGVVAAFLRVFALGGLVVGPMVGILGEALLVELAFTLVGARLHGAVLAGALALMEAPLQKLVTTWLVLGSEAIVAVVRVTQRLVERLGLAPPSPLVLLAVALGAAAALGAVAGAWAWRLAGRVEMRLGGGP